MDKDLDQLFTNKLFHYIQDGIIVMNEDREIVKANQPAKQLLGWKVGDQVPYCSYCQHRDVNENEERCYLMENKGKIPYFSSEMPAFGNYMLDVEMSNVFIYNDQTSNHKYYLLVLRDQTSRKKEEEARISKDMIQKLTDAKEEEHKRLSQELHDGVGQSLYSISLAMDHIMAKQKDEHLQDYIQEVRSEIGRVMDDVTYYSQILRPKSLDQLGLVATVESLINTIEEKLPDTTFQLQYNFNERLASIIEINTYRVIQEAIHNIMKYAMANYVSIDLNKENDTLYIDITDDGIGFDVNQQQKGLGLLHMRERISHLNGLTKVNAAPGKGTRIQMTIPLGRNEWDENSSR